MKSSYTRGSKWRRWDLHLHTPSSYDYVDKSITNKEHVVHMFNFSQLVCEKLHYYIYIYIDPRNGEIFYVGKGKGNRAFAHLSETSEKEKVKRIYAIRASGREPTIEILIHGLEDEETAMRIEASVIDLLDIHQLTNIQRGYHSRTFGRMGIDQVIATYAPKRVVVSDPVLAFRINQTFHYGMNEQELYDYTRHAWKLGRRREQARYAFAVYHGIVQEIYEIEKWLPQNSTPNIKHERGESSEVNTDRWEFVGKVAQAEIRKKYLYSDISAYLRSTQQPCVYINC